MTFLGNERIYRLYKTDKNFWNPYSLTCDDFIITDSIPNPLNPNEQARLSSQFWRIINRVYNYPNVLVISTQIPTESYMKICSNYILNHEQLHFDIRELYCRQMKDTINAIWYTSYERKLRILHDLDEELSKYQDFYDSSIIYSIYEKEEQLKWDSLIRKRLNILNK
jgi:hypothetical protein